MKIIFGYKENMYFYERTQNGLVLYNKQGALIQNPSKELITVAEIIEKEMGQS